MNAFPSKVLLVGEYAVLFGSEALAFPWFYYTAHWAEKKDYVDPDLKKLLDFFRKDDAWRQVLNLDEFQNDIDRGWYIKSNIPVAYGLGSSGAVCAAVWQRYRLKPSDELKKLRQIFQKMESHFHGRSSGIDPMICFLQKAVYISEGQLQPIENARLALLASPAIYLIDTGVSRQAKNFIELFRKEMEEMRRRNAFIQKWKSLNQNFIYYLLNNDTQGVFEQWKIISSQSLIDFSPMIFGSLSAAWKEGLARDEYYLKLCGAGGGGFYLALVNDEKKFKDKFQQNYKLLQIRQTIMPF